MDGSKDAFLHPRASNRAVHPYSSNAPSGSAHAAWPLYIAGAAVLLFIGLFWLCDLKHWTGWTFPVRAAGSNTLLTYLLPDLWYFFFVSAGITFLDSHWNVGAPGVIKSLVFTAIILALSALLTRSKVRMQL
jgi:heparan-alpha-glucosaminide N-acetyltransferase